MDALCFDRFIHAHSQTCLYWFRQSWIQQWLFDGLKSLRAGWADDGVRGHICSSQWLTSESCPALFPNLWEQFTADSVQSGSISVCRFFAYSHGQNDWHVYEQRRPIKGGNNFVLFILYMVHSKYSLNLTYTVKNYL